MKAPWFTDVGRQAEVLDRVAEVVISDPKRVVLMNQAQEKMWDKYDQYMLRRGAE